MRTVSNESIQAQAKQPDIAYISDTQLMDVADSFNYSYDDYKEFVHTITGRRLFNETEYLAHRYNVRVLGQEYLAAAIEDVPANSIIGAHW